MIYAAFISHRYKTPVNTGGLLPVRKLTRTEDTKKASAITNVLITRAILYVMLISVLL